MTSHRYAPAVGKDAADSVGSSWTQRLQRKCACGAATAHDECSECRATRLQRKSAQQGEHSGHARELVGAAVTSGGEPLAPVVRARFEPAFGHDFSRVRVHADSQAAASAAAVNANAFTLENHIVFGGGRYRPQSAEGRLLIAHELAHVVQQSGAGPGAALADDPRLERQADAAAERAVRGQGAAISAAQAPIGVMADGKGTKSTQTKPAEPKALSEKEAKIVEKARSAALIRTYQAYSRVAGIGPPSPEGRPDIATYEHQQRARELARKMFDWDPPNMSQVEEIVSHMLNGVGSGTDYRKAAPGDTDCGNRAGYVRDHRQPVVLCPAFFKQGPEEQIRTLIHESAHLAGIGKADTAESYCVIFNCEQSCGGFESADSWGQFVHCLSGQAPDKPDELKAKSGGRKAKKP